MKRIYIYLVLIAMYSVMAMAMHNRASKEKLEGRWNVKVTNAPGGYQDYVFDINEDKGEYTVDILFVDSRFRLPNRTLTLKDGKLTGNVTVDGETIEITIWEEKGVMQGTAKSRYIGTLPMTFTRPKN